MSLKTSNNSLQSSKVVEKEEYEIQLYGFTLGEFTRENFMFVEQNITKAVNDLMQSSNHLMKDLKPESKWKIDNAAKKVAQEIKEFSEDGVGALNKKVEGFLSIPDNVLLLSNNLHDTIFSEADVNELTEECQRYEQIVLENAFFIHALNAEIEGYQKLQKVAEGEAFITSKVTEELSNNYFNVDLLLHLISKLQFF